VAHTAAITLQITTENETMTKQAISIQSEAHAAAAKVTADSTLNKVMEAETERREESKRTPIHVMYAAIETWGEEGLFDMPEPDSGPEGNNPDKYEETIPNSKRTRKGSFWKDTFLGIPFVKKNVDYLEKVKLAAGKEPPVELKDLYSKGPAYLEAEKKMYSARVNAAVNVGYNGIRLAWQLRRIGEYPNVEVEISEDDTGDVARRSNPICIFELFPLKTSEGKDHPKAGQRTGMLKWFSVGEILALNIDRALEKGGTFESLWRSGKREPQTPDLSANVQTVDTFSEYTASMWYFAQRPKAYDQGVNYYLNPEHAHELKTLRDVSIYIDKILGNRAVQTMLDKLDAETAEESAGRKVA
jgi:hypothetical protein